MKLDVKTAEPQGEPDSGSCSQLAAWLEALATRLRFSGTEWRTLALILTTPAPITAHALARRLRLPYPRVKATVRGLLAWRVLERSSSGVTFQPDAARWGPLNVPFDAPCGPPDDGPHGRTVPIIRVVEQPGLTT